MSQSLQRALPVVPAAKHMGSLLHLGLDENSASGASLKSLPSFSTSGVLAVHFRLLLKLILEVAFDSGCW